MASSLVERVLESIEQNGVIDSEKVSQNLKEDHQKVVGAIKSILSVGNVIEAEQQSRTSLELTAEGEDVATHGSYEVLLYNAVTKHGVPQATLMKSVPNSKIGFSKAIQAGWITIDKQAEGGPKVVQKAESVEDVTQRCLQQLKSLQLDDVSAEEQKELRKRKLVTEVKVTSYLLKKGPEFRTSLEKPETDITTEMVHSGSWKDKQFKPYNFAALGVPPARGHLHPLLKVRAEFRQIFLEMGFCEMPTNRYVESSFWNFDALFQPQQHPARDAHDTFFISDPAEATEFPPDYLERVKNVHSHGGYGSQGYQYDWKVSEARKNLLRTHTTAVSARMLYQLAQKAEFQPAKYFSIDRVFRNESLDATHLAEFHQIEGLVADRNLALSDLIGIIYQFFRKLGIEKLRFKPAYNPYTEPSLEIFSYHEGLKKWVEIGNSGIFRPEMLLPMGLPEDVNVIAWGLSLERPTMIKYGIDNIRQLFGPRVNLGMIQSNPICRLDKQS